MAASASPTPAEWTRFMSARGNDAQAAAEMYRMHAEWRTQHLPLPPSVPSLGSGLPRMATFLDERCREGSRLLLVLVRAAPRPEALAEREAAHARQPTYDDAKANAADGAADTAECAGTLVPEPLAHRAADTRRMMGREMTNASLPTTH